MIEAGHFATRFPLGIAEYVKGHPDREKTKAVRVPRRSDYGHYRIMTDGRGWHLHLTKVDGWPRRVEDNPFGLYLYVDDVDAVADRVRESIIEKGSPHLKPWGTYEFAVSDPNGTLVRIVKSV